MTTIKSMAYERETCIVCQHPLKHKPTGRPRHTCSGRCRTAYHRHVKRWTKSYVDAIMNGRPPPPHPYPFRPEPPRSAL